MGSAIVLFFVSAACMMSVTTSYYSATLDNMVTVTTSEYRPLSYVPLGLAILSIIMVSMKAFQMLDRSRNEQ